MELSARAQNIFFKCQLHTVSRTSFFQSINATLKKYDLSNLPPHDIVQLYLYGHPILTKSDNVKILQALIRFENETSCFS